LGRGEELVIVNVGGGGAEIVKLKAFEAPRLGAGLLTVTLAAPAEAMSPARIEAVSWVVLTKVVARSDPFHRTVAPETKLEPLTVRVNPGSPAFFELGLIPEIDGTGLLTVRVRFLVTLALAASVTRTLKVKIPDVVGVPLRTPVAESKLSPGGDCDVGEVMAQV
jgi:hypothetical protein